MAPQRAPRAAILAFLAVVRDPVSALDNGLARTPPMGWCSWNAYGRKFNESVFYETADAMKANGMQAAGYEYINVDGGWWMGSDTGYIGRNATGFFEYNTEKYPHGVAAVSDYIHKLGFKYGHYTDAGTKACNKDAPMSEGYEHQDALLFALGYGADMVKVDACADTLPALELVTRWQQQLNATGRKVLFSNCHNGCMTDRRGSGDNVNLTSPGGWEPWCASLSNMWRSSADISSNWPSIMHNLDSLKARGRVAQPGSWNDPDFLEVGVKNLALTPRSPIQKLDENQAHMSMWCITSSPLIAGLRMAPGGPGGGVANQTTLEILRNQAAIAINQEYCDEIDCGITNGGDLLSVLQAQAKGESLVGLKELQPLEQLKEQKFPNLGPCGGPTATKWVIKPIEQIMVGGHTTGKIPGSGCEQSTNQVYQLEKSSGKLTTLMTSLKGDCVVPVAVDPENKSDTTLRLVAGECNAGDKYKITPTGELSFTPAAAAEFEDAAPPLCVKVHPSSGGGHHTPPRKPSVSSAPEVWAKPLPNRGAAIALLNRAANATSMSVKLSDIPWLIKGASAKSCEVYDVWADTMRTITDGIIVYPDVRIHQAVLLRLSTCKTDDDDHGDTRAAAAAASPAPPVCAATDGVVYVDECGEGFTASDSAGQPDHTAVVQAALNASGAHTVVLRNLSRPTPWVVTPLFIYRSDITLQFEPNAFLHAKRGRACRAADAVTCFHGTGDSMIKVLGQRNVSIVGGPGSTIRMWKQDYLNFTEYMKAEWRMGIYLGHEVNNESAFTDCQDMTVRGLSIEQSGGDGIYVDNCERVLIQDVNSDGNNRQGAKHMLVERSNFSNTNGTAPAAGIDIEPDGAHYDLVNITIRDCLAVNNSGHGLQSWMNSGNAMVVEVLVERYHVMGSGSKTGGGFVFGRLHPDAGGSIVIQDSTATDTSFDGIYVWDEIEQDNGPKESPFHLVFENVVLTNTASSAGLLAPYSNQPGFQPQMYAPIGLDSLATYGNSGLVLTNVTVHDALRRPFLQANRKWGPAAVSGTVRVIKKVMQPMPGCTINSSLPFTNLSVDCQIV